METPTPHEQRVQVELERLRSANAKWQKIEYNVGRFFVRLFRIAFGIALAGVAVYLHHVVSEKSDIPFASMTVRDLATLLLGALGVLTFLFWAFQAAFGEAPNPQQEMEANLRRQAEQSVAVAEQGEAAREAATQAAAGKAAWWYRSGKAVGLLFNTTLTRRKK